ncbi:hypothetical protein GCM10010218_59800 [Streptomyces mashuensis]|uniref:Uncharacterized protein n=1 Tax=Streptomyces mashuensis TaxID=33904 RepID=A0A919B882_9ACTN|nr:hypothetical protein [Streptomyces mashuensis]GHF70580.1 hypothetical protein GCM10010218_59800 [Streptomyces mashuensis]
MSSPQQADPVEDEDVPQLTGTWSLVLGTAAVLATGCPLLPESVPPQLRLLPVYSILPLGIWAVGSGCIALRRMRGDERAGRIRARAGITLGTMATMTVVATVTAACWLI